MSIFLSFCCEVVFPEVHPKNHPVLHRYVTRKCRTSQSQSKGFLEVCRPHFKKYLFISGSPRTKYGHWSQGGMKSIRKLESDKYVHYLACGDGFTVYMHQNLSNCTFEICVVCCISMIFQYLLKLGKGEDEKKYCSSWPQSLFSSCPHKATQPTF